jgi:hypothetical protein
MISTLDERYRWLSHGLRMIGARALSEREAPRDLISIRRPRQFAPWLQHKAIIAKPDVATSASGDILRALPQAPDESLTGA